MTRSPLSDYSNLGLDDPFRTAVPQRVLVIGGGPSGLITLRNLVTRGQFQTVQLVERRDDIGGNKDCELTRERPRWPSPSYKGLIGNVLPCFLSFSGHPFPDPPNASEGQPYPTLRETQAYLKEFAEPYLKSGQIRLNTEVVRVEERIWGKGWTVVSRDWSEEGGGREVVEHWDAVVSCVFWYDHPAWPDTAGLGDLRDHGLAIHAKWWRGPELEESDLAPQRSIVIGNANSSNDIAAQLSRVAEAPVYQSIRRTAFAGYPSLPDERIKMASPVKRYTLKPRTGLRLNEIPTITHKFDAHLEDGTVLTDLDYVFLGTGYRPFPDFIKVFQRPEIHSAPDYSYHPQGELPEPDPPRIPHLHKLLFYAPNPSLAFTGAPATFTPFINGDVASTYIALVLSHVIPIPTSASKRLDYEQARLQLIQERQKVANNPSSLQVAYSVMAQDEEGYFAGLREEVVTVRPELDGLLPIWGPETTQKRVAASKIKIGALNWFKARGGGGNVQLEVLK
ncbi:FAD/NAD(P)-binding domain-containing protein [Coprinopsis marcescibilis]|uniref:FAD/NAD(P)-binding domain-containing protein n=1 Tax=Coprinopsis marcescibilis TaxID=230819 RepID=A0A5C3KV96_COPMA|nr:FAD/NAD(P)-binding domain-containing protein [Coprinopsis marcescibilis]